MAQDNYDVDLKRIETDEKYFRVYTVQTLIAIETAIKELKEKIAKIETKLDDLT